MPSGDGFRRRPIVAADFHPRRASLMEVPGVGIACGTRTRVSGLKARRPEPSRRTRHATSAVPERERPVGRGVSLHVAWRPGTKGRAHPGPPTPCHVATECTGTPEVERMTGLEPMPWPWRGLALPAELHPRSCKVSHRPVPVSPCGNLLKSVHRKRWCDRIGRWPVPLRRPVEATMKKARILIRPGPLRAERGRCAAKRSRLPDATDPRNGQGRRPAPAPSPCCALARARTQTAPGRVGAW